MIGAIVGGVAALGGAIAQAINNAKASKAEAKEIKKLEKLANDIKDPDFSVDNIDPVLIDNVFEYNPESIPFIQEKIPQLVEKSQVAQGALNQQMGALDRFEELAQTGEDAQLIAAREGAEREQMQSLSRAQAERDAMSQRRGLGMGSGAQLALGQADLTASAQTQQMMNEQAAADAALRRFQANQQVGSLGGQLYGQEVDLATRNTGITNAYNQRMAERQQNLATQNTSNTNQANLLAAQNAQNIATQNAQQQNNTNKFNTGNQMQAKRDDWSATMNKYGAKANVGNIRYGQIGKSAQRTASTIAGASQGVGGAAQSYEESQKDKAKSVMGVGG